VFLFAWKSKVSWFRTHWKSFAKFNPSQFPPNLYRVDNRCPYRNYYQRWEEVKVQNCLPFKEVGRGLGSTCASNKKSEISGTVGGQAPGFPALPCASNARQGWRTANQAWAGPRGGWASALPARLGASEDGASPGGGAGIPWLDLNGHGLHLLTTCAHSNVSKL
jgi:hypothetical protein